MASFVQITRVDISSTDPSIEFTSGGAWADYTDLLVVLSARTTRAAVGDFLGVVINGDSTSSNYEQRTLEGNGTSAQSETRTNKYELAFVGGDSTTNNTFSSSRIYFANINSDSHKAISSDSVIENNSSVGSQLRVAGLYKSTSAITSIELIPSVGDFKQYTSATLYGIKKYNTASAPKATGGIITYDATNNYWVHTFAASGTFTPTENLSNVEYLVIAGGGGGAGMNTTSTGGVGEGGGGAGGYRSSVTGESSGGGASAESPLSLTASTGYTVTVGAGGSGGAAGNNNGSTGSNSVFSTITSDGGGYGGTAAQAGGAGGSGGGAGRGNQTEGTATTNQGFNGGEGDINSWQGGAGGGAGGVGDNAPLPGGPGNAAVDGGLALSSSITGSAVFRAGGGGGGYQGAGGGGGAGNAGNPGGNATVNTGSGGGAGGSSGPGAIAGGNGGSGIVIVRYAA